MSDLPRDNAAIRIPVISILVTVLIVAIGFGLVGPLIGMLAAYPFFPGTVEEFSSGLENPFLHPELKTTLLITQGFATLIGMIVIPSLFLRAQRRPLAKFFRQPFYAQPVFIVPVLVIVFMGVNAVVIQWNESITLPFGIDDWARAMEKKLGEATEFITQFDSFSNFMLAFVVVAVLPAIGEEIVFRGMIQNDFYRGTGNIHVAVWVSAILFSAIHLQFYGFVPRMLLGALFGYLYAWSGNLWMPVLAHFVNNGFTIVGLYLYQQGAFPINMEDTTSAPPWQAVVFSGLFSGVLLYAYKSFYNHHTKGDIPA